MKEYYSKAKSKKSGRVSLVLVMLLCAAMIGASCWFAYTQTAKEITIDLNSVLEEGELAAAAPETNLRRSSETTAPRTQTEEPTEPPATMPPQTALPETREAAVIFSPSTTAETVTETIIPTTAAQLPCYPINGEIIQKFSGGELVKSPTTGVWQTHNGIDIAASLGDTVCAMDAGVVVGVYEDALWGISVTIDHQNGIFSRYCGLNAGLNVVEGDTVSHAQVIGAVGDTADIESAMDSHLHFEVLQGDNYIDPVLYIDSE